MRPRNDAKFVHHMEDILDLYKRPYNPQFPLVCLDETSKQLVKSKKESIPIKAGQPKKYDYSYFRNGNKMLTIVFEPLGGWREITITDNRRTKEWIDILINIADNVYPLAEKIILVQDNLNTHQPYGFYKFLPPDKARHYIDRFEFHYTPKHASWLNMAEIELSVLSRQCLSNRISNEMQLLREVEAWCFKRNNEGKTMDWQFTTEDSRIMLKSLYPNYLP